MFYDEMESPVGRLRFVGNGEGLKEILFLRGQGSRRPPKEWKQNPAALRAARRQLEAYFAGKRTEFTLKLAPEGTAFQRRVWKALSAIPYGKTISYGDLARRIGNRKAVRAVGGANGRNPIPIVVPCHRVIGSDGTLTGYGGGLPIKEGLLLLECNFEEFRR